MKERKDNIYIYLWEGFNTIYIGRTVNPKGRHYQHKHRDSERTYQFSSEHHVEHPKMTIIENDLTIEEGVEREKYWIQYYKEKTNYKVLNRTRGGQIGELSSLTEQEKKQMKKEYNKLHREERNAYYRNYYQERNAEKKFLKAQKKVECKILNGEKKIRKLIQKESYYITHKEEILEKRKEYRNANKERYKSYWESYKKSHKDVIKKYRDKHRSRIKEYQHIYYKMHKEERREYMKEYRSRRKNA